MIAPTEFESLKRLVMTWEKENLDLALQLLKGSHELKTAMEDFLEPLFDAIPEHLSLSKHLGQLPQYVNSIQLDRFEPDEALANFMESMPTERLSFSYRKLDEFPLWVCGLKRLRHLLLQDCGLTEIPEAIGNLENLEQLNLDKNGLRTIPASIGRLQKLRKLQLDFNLIEDLPEEVGQLHQLEWLCLENNNVRLLPKSCLQLSNLRWLSIEGTPLGEEHRIRSGMFIQASSPRFAKFCDAI